MAAALKIYTDLGDIIEIPYVFSDTLELVDQAELTNSQDFNIIENTYTSPKIKFSVETRLMSFTQYYKIRNYLISSMNCAQMVWSDHLRGIKTMKISNFTAERGSGTRDGEYSRDLRQLKFTLTEV